MRYYQPTLEDKNAVAYRRSFDDAAEGRVGLAFQRLADYQAIFPGDADLLYAEGLLRIDYLGDGMTGQNLCWQAVHRPNAPRFAAFNALKYAPTREAFLERAPEAQHLGGNEPGIAEMIRLEQQVHADGEPYWQYLVSLLPDPPEKDPGGAAALLQLILAEGGQEMPPPQYTSCLRKRGELLRLLDRQAENRMRFLGERFLPADRLALQQGLAEFEAGLEDPYFRQPEMYNFCAAWSLLLERYDACLAFADRAIAARPQGYAYPYHNKARALWELGRAEEAEASLQEGMRQAEQAGDHTQVAQMQEARDFWHQLPISSLEEARPLLDHILSGAGDASYAEISKSGETLEKAGQAYYGYVQRAGLPWSMKYLNLVENLLTFVSPESAHFIVDWIIGHVPEADASAFTANVMYAAIYLIAHGEGVVRRDAARLVVFYLVQIRDTGVMRTMYRQGICDMSAADPEFAEVQARVDKELCRLHPRLPEWLAMPATAEGLARAREVIAGRYRTQPDSGRPGDAPRSGWGFFFVPLGFTALVYFIGHFMGWW